MFTSHQPFSHGWCFDSVNLQESDRHKDEDVKERQAWRRWAATDSVGRGGDAGPGRRRRSNIYIYIIYIYVSIIIYLCYLYIYVLYVM